MRSEHRFIGLHKDAMRRLWCGNHFGSWVCPSGRAIGTNIQPSSIGDLYFKGNYSGDLGYFPQVKVPLCKSGFCVGYREFVL